MLRRSGSEIAGNVALVLLVLAISAAMVLFALTFGGQKTATFEVGRFSDAACPGDTSANIRCYQSVLTNVSGVSAHVRCSLIGTDGPPAAFLNRSTEYVSAAPIDPSSSINLLIQLAPTALASPALPQLTCVSA